MKRVLVVGGGFAGLNVARGLRRVRDLEVTLVDRRNHHLFQPLLYQVAMAGLSPAEIAAPIRSLLSRQRNARVRQESVRRVSLAEGWIETQRGLRHAYDTLVLAPGAVDSYFGHPEWSAHAPGLKSLDQALEIRRRVLHAYEQAELATDPQRRKELLTFAVVGGGPTGVELAGALGEMSRFTLAKDFREIDPKLARVLLIEAGPRILPAFPEKLAARATRDLEALGVQVWTSSPVTHVDEKGIDLGNERVAAATVLWAAGVRASPLLASLGVPLDRQGRVEVEPDLSLPGHPNVFVLGDAASFAGPDDVPLPGVAPVAIQQGRYVARRIRDELRGGSPAQPKPFRYRDRGQMATIGRKRAVAETGGLRFGGFFAWWLWLVVHIFFLVGFKNRLFVVMQWAWAYLAFYRGARLIVERDLDEAETG